jgi:hypothetical protein
MKKGIITIVVALFATVVFGQTKTEVKPNVLPKCVSEWLTKNMKGFSIDKSFKIDNKGEISYAARVVKGQDKRWLEFNGNCKDVKKIAVDPEKGEAKKTGEENDQAKKGRPPQTGK